MNEPKYKPIIFTAPMVRAILEGRKTQTRRIMKTQPGEHWKPHSYGDIHKMQAGEFIMRRGEPIVIGYGPSNFDGDEGYPCPYGQPGDRLWVKEGFRYDPADYCWEASVSVPIKPEILDYRADFPDEDICWQSGITMPRWASRINLEITGVRVEMVQDISEDDIFADGIEKLSDPCDVKTERAMKKCLGKNEWDAFGSYWTNPIFAYRCLWQSLHGQDSWDKNPWVWVIEFKKVDDK